MNLKRVGAIAATIALLLAIAGMYFLYQKSINPHSLLQTSWFTPPSGSGPPLGGCNPGQTYTDILTSNVWTCSGLKVWALPALLVLRGSTGGVGGSPLAAGACVTTTVTVTGALPSMVAGTSPVSDPGAGFYWYARVNTINQVTVYLCAAVAGTPSTTAYQVSVNP